MQGMIRPKVHQAADQAAKAGVGGMHRPMPRPPAMPQRQGGNSPLDLRKALEHMAQQQALGPQLNVPGMPQQSAGPQQGQAPGVEVVAKLLAMRHVMDMVGGR